MSTIEMPSLSGRIEEMRNLLDLPETAPIPGAMYRSHLGGSQDYITIAAVEIFDKGRWSAIAMSVRYGETRITSESNRFGKDYKVHALPSIVPPEEKPDLDTCIDLAIMEAHA